LCLHRLVNANQMGAVGKRGDRKVPPTIGRGCKEESGKEE
jgi:hypothetical protein